MLDRIHQGSLSAIYTAAASADTVAPVCALVIGLAYGLDGPTALATYQALHCTTCMRSQRL